MSNFVERSASACEQKAVDAAIADVARLLDGKPLHMAIAVLQESFVLAVKSLDDSDAQAVTVSLMRRALAEEFPNARAN